MVYWGMLLLLFLMHLVLLWIAVVCVADVRWVVPSLPSRRYQTGHGCSCDNRAVLLLEAPPARSSDYDTAEENTGKNSPDE